MAVEVQYGGQTYTIVGRSVDEVQAEVDGLVASGVRGWLTAYDGHGSRYPYRLLIAPGIPIALAEVPIE